MVLRVLRLASERISHAHAMMVALLSGLGLSGVVGCRHGLLQQLAWLEGSNARCLSGPALRMHAAGCWHGCTLTGVRASMAIDAP